MVPETFMLIAGEPSGDLLAAELVHALREECVRKSAPPTDDVQPLRTTLSPRFFGAGGPTMAQAGVELAFDMTAHAVVGLVEVFKNYGKFRRLFKRLLKLAIEREPDAIICVDFSGFNRRFARAIKSYVRPRQGPFFNWNPKVIQYISPQVWASREGRARQLERDFDLLLCIFPFEKDWYALRAPSLRVEFVGHPLVDRYARARNLECSDSSPIAARPVAEQERDDESAHSNGPLVVLLPGSRESELRRHLPAMVEAARIIKSKTNARFRMVLPTERLAAFASETCKLNIWRELAEPAFDPNAHPYVRRSIGDLAEVLPRTDLAIASTGTVTLECAYFGVPTVAIYKTSWGNYQIGKRVIRVNLLAMPNLLAGETIYPELIQDAATPENIAREALELLSDESRRTTIKAKLAKVIKSLGGPGASQRAARAIVDLLR